MIRRSVKNTGGVGSAPAPASCPHCGATFECGMEAGLDHCWCSELPGLTELDPIKGCYCKRCLDTALRARG